MTRETVGSASNRSLQQKSPKTHQMAFTSQRSRPKLAVYPVTCAIAETAIRIRPPKCALMPLKG